MAKHNKISNLSSEEKRTPQRWHVWLSDSQFPAFYMGSTMLILSLAGFVPARLGWLGFAFALPAAVLSYRLKRPAVVEPRGYVMLNAHLLASKGGAYHNVIDRFQDGDTLIYDGMEFDCRSDKEIECRIVADRINLNDNAVIEIATHAQSVLRSLSNDSADFGAAVAGRGVKVLIMSGYGKTAFELCRVLDGEIDWR
jgi:hypothetical protein